MRIRQWIIVILIEGLTWAVLVEGYRVFVGGPGTASFRTALGLLVTVRIAFWLADPLRRYLIWRFVTREERVQYLLSLMRDNGFLPPLEKTTFANYMFGIEEDEDAPPIQRMIARELRVTEEVVADMDWVAGAQLFWERIYAIDRFTAKG